MVQHGPPQQERSLRGEPDQITNQLPKPGNIGERKNSSDSGFTGSGRVKPTVFISIREPSAIGGQASMIDPAPQVPGEPAAPPQQILISLKRDTLHRLNVVRLLLCRRLVRYRALCAEAEHLPGPYVERLSQVL